MGDGVVVCGGVWGVVGCVGGWGWDNGGRLHLLDPFESSTLLLQLRVGNH